MPLVDPDAEATRELAEMVKAAVAARLDALEGKIDKLLALSEELAPVARRYVAKADVLKLRRRG